MNELPRRAALALLLTCGLYTAAQALGFPDPAQAAALQGLGVEGSLGSAVWHRQFMLALLGAGLVLAVFVPSLRLAAIAAAVLSKTAFVAISWSAAAPQGLPAAAWGEVALVALLLAAGALFLRESRQEARWEGMLPLRPEA